MVRARWSKGRRQGARKRKDHCPSPKPPPDWTAQHTEKCHPPGKGGPSVGWALHPPSRCTGMNSNGGGQCLCDPKPNPQKLPGPGGARGPSRWTESPTRSIASKPPRPLSVMEELAAWHSPVLSLPQRSPESSKVLHTQWWPQAPHFPSTAADMEVSGAGSTLDSPLCLKTM